MEDLTAANAELVPPSAAANGWPADAGCSWSRTFLATPDQARAARGFLADLLGTHPCADSAITCLSELVTNASAHSRSARTGGQFHVQLRRSGPAIRVEVADQGGPWIGRLPDPEHGRGLVIVQALASRVGVVVTGPSRDPWGRAVWYELDPPGVRQQVGP